VVDEVMFQKDIWHANVVRTFGLVSAPGCLATVSELYEPGDLKQYLRNAEANCTTISLQLKVEIALGISQGGGLRGCVAGPLQGLFRAMMG
jgi:hypothetical protein